MNIWSAPSGSRPLRPHGERYARRYFRMAQSVWGQVQQRGLRRTRVTDADFRLRAKMLSPPSHTSKSSTSWQGSGPSRRNSPTSSNVLRVCIIEQHMPSGRRHGNASGVRFKISESAHPYGGRRAARRQLGREVPYRILRGGIGRIPAADSDLSRVTARAEKRDAGGTIRFGDRRRQAGVVVAGARSVGPGGS